MRVLILLFLGMLRGPATLLGSEPIPPSEVRMQVCRVLDVDADNCASRVEFLATPNSGVSGRLRVIHQRPTAFGNQVTLQSSAPATLPFLVMVHDPDNHVPADQRSVQAARTGDFIVHPGQIAVLVQESTGIRLTRKVRCLERGGRGDFIRVRDLAGGKSMRAVVVRQGELSAIF